MATFLITPSLIHFSILLFFSALAATAAGEDDRHVAPPSGKEKLSHLHFYFHDVLSGHNPTAVPVVQAPHTNASETTFGMVTMVDDLLTEGPEPTSKLVGRAQGLYASASQEEVGLLMTMNFAFTSGQYNGSTLCILGRNTVFSDVRELPVVGGSGLFRWARGYAEARTHTLDVGTGDAIVEYNVYVMHY